ncbi:hypothetical protein D9758_014429 [Tetrapyrgos nigripes]|uniref:Uncharacterized protein n=1 Tax=Tetrapyrgos nigripes TaxID=182062 RepID=A0A8H5CN83_9AGAR|nr:hypothetical protein D9758_014429 [Tetrapyrgos nigripes]
MIMFEKERMLVLLERLGRGATGRNKEDRNKERDVGQSKTIHQVSPSITIKQMSSLFIFLPMSNPHTQLHSEPPIPLATLPHLPPLGSPATSAHRKEEVGYHVIQMTLGKNCSSLLPPHEASLLPPALESRIPINTTPIITSPLLDLPIIKNVPWLRLRIHNIYLYTSIILDEEGTHFRGLESWRGDRGTIGADGDFYDGCVVKKGRADRREMLTFQSQDDQLVLRGTDEYRSVLLTRISAQHVHLPYTCQITSTHPPIQLVFKH